MKFDQFAMNVQKWASDRGIYQHSTALAQSHKGFEELCELCEGIATIDMNEIKDGIGDVAVCVVNVATMGACGLSDCFTQGIERRRSTIIEQGLVTVAEFLPLTKGLNKSDPEMIFIGLSRALTALRVLAEACGVEFEDCLQCAWDEIKDRKGHMIKGGTFIKDGD